MLNEFRLGIFLKLNPDFAVGCVLNTLEVVRELDLQVTYSGFVAIRAHRSQGWLKSPTEMFTFENNFSSLINK